MTDTCTGIGLYNSLGFCKGKSVLPGIRNHVLGIRKGDILVWPKLPTIVATTQSEIATYTGNFTLAADKKWLKIDLSLNKGQIEYETQGEKPSCTFLNKITLSHPEPSANALGFARQAVSDDMVYLVPQRDGQYRVVGSEFFETVTKPKGSTGEGISGTASADLEIEATDVCPAPYYPGNIVTEEGTISGKDGSIVTTPAA